MTKTSPFVSFNHNVGKMNERFTLSHVRYFIDSVGLDKDDLDALIEHLQAKQRAEGESIWSKIRGLFCCMDDSTITRDSLDLTRVRFNIDPNSTPKTPPTSPARLNKYQEKPALSLDTQPPSPRRKALSINVPRTPPSPIRGKQHHARFEELMSPRMQTLANMFSVVSPPKVMSALHTVFEDVVHM